MNTFLSSSQEAVREQYSKFAAQEIQPIAVDLEKGKTSLKEFLQRLGQTGFLGLTIPKEYGGTGGTFLDQILFIEAVGEHEAGVAFALSAHIQVVELLKRYGSDTQKSRYLPLLARGEAIGSLCLNEEKAGSDFSSVETVVKPGVDGYTLSGQKIWVVNGKIASLLIVSAKDTETGKLTLWLLDSSNQSGLKMSPGVKKLGLRSASVDQFEFLNTSLTDANLLEGDGKEQVDFALDTAKVVMAAAAVGLVHGATKLAVEHARTREQFGKTIGHFQGIQWKLADISTDHAAARLMTLRAAWAFDESKEEFRNYASMAKLIASKTARFQSGEALQVMGAAGLNEDTPMERFYRDAKMMEICQGTSEMQKVIIADELKV